MRRSKRRSCESVKKIMQMECEESSVCELNPEANNFYHRNSFAVEDALANNAS